jgi:hypothetical protein
MAEVPPDATPVPSLGLLVEALRRTRGRNVTFLLDGDAHEAGELIVWPGRKVPGTPSP